MAVTDLPALNASLNLVAAVLLALGYAFVRRGDVKRHRICMVAACIISALFLASYSVYHWNVGSVRYTGDGWVRTVYFTILASHIVLAMAIVPLVAVTLWRAWTGAFNQHRRVARWAWPFWMYVSVTGVIIYWMLYHG